MLPVLPLLPFPISISQLVIGIGTGNIFTLATFPKFHSTTTTLNYNYGGERGVVCYQYHAQVGSMNYS